MTIRVKYKVATGIAKYYYVKSWTCMFINLYRLLHYGKWVCS